MIQILAFVEDLENPHHRKEELEDPQQREKQWNVRELIIGNKKKWLKLKYSCLLHGSWCLQKWIL